MMGVGYSQAAIIFSNQQVCHTVEVDPMDQIQQSLSHIQVNLADSNTSNIAFIIASAITSKHPTNVDTQSIATYLQQGRVREDTYTLLDIKKVFDHFQLSIDTSKDASPTELLSLTNEVLIAQDQQKNVFAVVGASKKYVYLVYGIVNHEALICSIEKSEFINAFTTNKFLILR